MLDIIWSKGVETMSLESNAQNQYSCEESVKSVEMFCKYIATILENLKVDPTFKEVGYS